MRALIYLLILLILFPSSFAALSCTIQAGPCAGVVVLKLTGATDAHAYPATSPLGSHRLCCTGIADLSVDTVGGTFFVGLSGSPPGDSHIATNPASYASNYVLKSPTNTINCGYRLSPLNCAAYDTCLYGVDSAGTDDLHVMDCTTPFRTCCSATPAAVPSCTDTDGGSNYNLQGTTVDAFGPLIDTCVSPDLLTEHVCNASNASVIESHICPDGCALSGAGECEAAAPSGFPCLVDEFFWTDGYEHGLTEAVLNYPVYAIITGTNCSETTADFTIYDEAKNIIEANPLGDNLNYLDDAGTRYALVNWTPSATGNYYFKVNSINGLNSEETADSALLEVKGACLVADDAEPVGPCPEEWAPNPENLDADCDGVRDCLDQWVGNYEGEIDPNTGVPVGHAGCGAEAWDCSDTTFSDCEPEPGNAGNYIQTRQGSCVKNPEYVGYCPEPLDEQGCVIEEDFPLFGWLNFVMVSLLLVGFYSIIRNVY